MKTLWLPFWVVLAFGSVTEAEELSDYPNVVILFTDDQGTLDVNC